MNVKDAHEYAIKLICELDFEGKRWGRALLLVGFPEESRVVWSVSQEPLQELEKLLLEGGTPVGIIMYKGTDSKEDFFWYVLDERAHDKWSQSYMESFIITMDRYKAGEPLR